MKAFSTLQVNHLNHLGVQGPGCMLGGDCKKEAVDTQMNLEDVSHVDELCMDVNGEVETYPTKDLQEHVAHICFFLTCHIVVVWLKVELSKLLEETLFTKLRLLQNMRVARRTFSLN